MITVKTEPVFKTIGEALSMAFAMEIREVGLKSSTNELIKDIRKQRYGEPPLPVGERRINTEGLTEQEVRGQCAQIRERVARYLPQSECEVIYARFGKDERRDIGIQCLSQRFLGACTTSSPHAVRELIRGIYEPGVRQKPGESVVAFNQRRSKREANWSLRAVAKRYDAAFSTLRRDQVMIRKVCTELESSAQTRLEAIFVRDGLVADPND